MNDGSRPNGVGCSTMPFFNHDIPCPSCGYNLRGLSLDRGCPECGLKIVAASLSPEARAKIQSIEDEVEENLRRQEHHAAMERRLCEFLAAWEQRGERFDRLLDALEEILRHSGKE